jgi:hypothetical protein
MCLHFLSALPYHRPILFTNIQGHVVTVELSSGQTYRGKLLESKFFRALLKRVCAPTHYVDKSCAILDKSAEHQEPATADTIKGRLCILYKNSNNSRGQHECATKRRCGYR